MQVKMYFAILLLSVISGLALGHPTDSTGGSKPNGVYYNDGKNYAYAGTFSGNQLPNDFFPFAPNYEEFNKWLSSNLNSVNQQLANGFKSVPNFQSRFGEDNNLAASSGPVVKSGAGVGGGGIKGSAGGGGGYAFSGSTGGAIPNFGSIPNYGGIPNFPNFQIPNFGDFVPNFQNSIPDFSKFPAGAHGASASASLGPNGVVQTASIHPENPKIPNIVQRTGFGGDGSNGDGHYFVASSSSSGYSNKDGKVVPYNKAQTTINDNGKVTTYTVHN